MEQKFDLIVIGTGSGGSTAAATAALSSMVHTSSDIGQESPELRIGIGCWGGSG